MFQLLISLIGATVPICVRGSANQCNLRRRQEEILPAQEGIR
jgi:hypothetical protein